MPGNGRVTLESGRNLGKGLSGDLSGGLMAHDSCGAAIGDCSPGLQLRGVQTGPGLPGTLPGLGCSPDANDGSVHLIYYVLFADQGSLDAHFGHMLEGPGKQTGTKP